jgi:hypothetical protein
LASGTWNEPDDVFGAMMIYNGTHQMIALNVASVPWLECNALGQFGDELLQGGDFQSEGLVRLAPAAVFPLTERPCGCGLFQLTAGGRSSVVRVPEGSIRMEAHPTVQQRRRHRARMLVIGDDFRFAPGQAIQTVEVVDEVESADCGDEPPAMAFTAPWSTNSNREILGVQVLDVQPVAGNCFEVTVQPTEIYVMGQGGEPGAAGAGAAGGEEGLAGAQDGGDPVTLPSGPSPMFLCAPIEMFPFVSGDVVDVTLSRQGGGGGTGGSSGFGSGGGAGGATLNGSVGYHTVSLETSDRRFTLRVGERTQESQITQDSCGPVRDGDGAPWFKIEVGAGSGFTQPLVPGEIRSFEEAGGTLDVYLGRSRQFLGCNPGLGEANVEIAERWSL